MASAHTFAVIGLGTFGSTVARDLSEAGNQVLGIDNADAPVSALADVLRETAIADARDEQALREAGVGQCDTALVAIGNDLEANIVSVMNVKVIGVKQVWAKAISRTHHRILSRLGVDRVVHPERQMGQRVAQMLHNPLVRDYVSLGNGYYAISVVVPESMSERAVSSLRLSEDFDLRCLDVMRGSKRLTDIDKDPTLEIDDRMLVLGKRGDLRKFSDQF